MYVTAIYDHDHSTDFHPALPQNVGSQTAAVEQLPSTHTTPYPPPQNAQAPDALAFIEQQKKTIESYMAQVSHQ
jgi:hypothetical protein